MELKVIFFLVLIFFVGLTLYYLKYSKHSSQEKVYDYTLEDSLFLHSDDITKSADSANKIVEKIVDSESELLDFRARKLSEGVNPPGNLDLKVNINTASVENLCRLPGIGEKTAEKIVAFRINNGRFKTIAEIKLVKGIGEAKFNRVKEFIFIE